MIAFDAEVARLEIGVLGDTYERARQDMVQFVAAMFLLPRHLIEGLQELEADEPITVEASDVL